MGSGLVFLMFRQQYPDRNGFRDDAENHRMIFFAAGNVSVPIGV